MSSGLVSPVEVIAVVVLSSLVGFAFLAVDIWRNLQGPRERPRGFFSLSIHCNFLQLRLD